MLCSRFRDSSGKSAAIYERGLAKNSPTPAYWQAGTP